MSPSLATTLLAPLAAAPPATASPVVVVFEPTAAGEAALETARTLAESAGAPLTVMAVASRERTDIGCGACRSAAAFHNELACELAADDLTKARTILAARDDAVVEAGQPAVEYVLGRGTFARIVAAVAERREAAVVVLPERDTWALWRRVTRDRAKAVRRRGGWSVIVAGDRPEAPAGSAGPDLPSS